MEFPAWIYIYLKIYNFNFLLKTVNSYSSILLHPTHELHSHYGARRGMEKENVWFYILIDSIIDTAEVTEPAENINT